MRAFKPVERDVGSYAIRSMAEFARLEESAEGRERIAIEARGISVDGADVWVRTIQSLRHDHASEWQNVIEDMAPDAWFRCVAENAA